MNDQTPQHLPAARLLRTREDAEAYLRRIGEIGRELAAIDASHDAMIANLEKTRAEKSQPLITERDTLIESLRVWASVRRHELTGGGRAKRVPLNGGVIAWRKRPPRVVLHDKPQAIAEALKAAGFDELVRIRIEPDRAAMLKHPAKVRSIPGVEIAPGYEDFVVEPGAEK